MGSLLIGAGYVLGTTGTGILILKLLIDTGIIGH